jgi:hypothetical protein
MLNLFASAHQAFPIGEIAGETQLASSLPSHPRQCGVPFSAFRIVQISIAAPCAVDVRRKWVAMRFHVGYERFDLDDRFAEIRERSNKPVRVHKFI